MFWLSCFFSLYLRAQKLRRTFYVCFVLRPVSKQATSSAWLCVMQMNRIMFFGTRTCLHIFWRVLSFFFSILQPSLAFFCLKNIPWIWLYLCFPLCTLKDGPQCPTVFSPTWHSVDIVDRVAISLPMSSVSQIQICWLVSSWSLARHAWNDLLPAVCAALSTSPQIKEPKTNVPTRQIFLIKISLGLFKSFQSPRMPRYRRSACINISAALSFNIL